MRKDKEKAVELRRNGRSYKQISSDLGIPLGTISGWFRGQKWSEEIREHLSKKVSLSNPNAVQAMVIANKMRWTKWRQSHREIAIQQFSELKKDPLFLSGIMLYWGEGDKSSKNSTLKLSNSDPAMIKVFYLFLVKSLEISPEKIFISLINYPDLVDSVQKTIWSRATGIPLSQFKNSVVIQGRHPTKRNSYGVCMIMVHSRAFKDRILQWIELYKTELTLPFPGIVF